MERPECIKPGEILDYGIYDNDQLPRIGTTGYCLSLNKQYTLRVKNIDPSGGWRIERVRIRDNRYLSLHHAEIAKPGGDECTHRFSVVDRSIWLWSLLPLRFVPVVTDLTFEVVLSRAGATDGTTEATDTEERVIPILGTQFAKAIFTSWIPALWWAAGIIAVLFAFPQWIVSLFPAIELGVITISATQILFIVVVGLLAILMSLIYYHCKLIGRAEKLKSRLRL